VVGYDSILDEESLEWHNDSHENENKKYLTANCFFDNCSPEVGGFFDIKSIIMNDFKRVYPKKNNIIIFNQDTNFVHRAGRSKKNRRLIELAFFF